MDKQQIIKDLCTALVVGVWLGAVGFLAQYCMDELVLLIALR